MQQTNNSSQQTPAAAAPSTPAAPLPFGSASFMFGNSTTPAGQPPAFPLVQSSTQDAQPLEHKGFSLGTSGTTTALPSSTPFVFCPSASAQTGSDKSNVSFSFGEISAKNTQTQPEKASETSSVFSLGSGALPTPTFTFGTTPKTETLPTSLEKPSAPLEPLKSAPTFSFGASTAQQQPSKNETTSIQKSDAPKPTFTFGTTSNTTTKSADSGTATSNEAKTGSSVSTLASTTTSGLFKPQMTVSSDTTGSETKNLSQTLSKTTSGSTSIAEKSTTDTAQELETSNLKNKTIEDIINKWTSDLENYSKQFAQQAAEVSKWDRLLIESGDKISKLYADTIEAEQIQLKVDQTLTYIESQQNEMSAFLDQYESQVQELSDRQFGGSDGMQPADQEREKVYNLAEKLTEQLNELGRNLTSMIEEINTASNLINKTNEDDPLSSIVRILNSHLSSLRWIQSTTTKLHYKIDEVKKAEYTIEKQLEENNFYSGRNIGFC